MIDYELLCSFHGKDISKGKQEKRLRKVAQELDARRASTGEGSSQSFSRIGGQQVAGTPYVVLSGNLQPGQSSDPASGFQTVERRVRVISEHCDQHLLLAISFEGCRVPLNSTTRMHD